MLELRSKVVNQFQYKLKYGSLTLLFKDPWIKDHVLGTELNHFSRALNEPNYLKVEALIRDSRRHLPPPPERTYVKT